MKKLIAILLVALAGCTTTQPPANPPQQTGLPPMPPMPPAPAKAVAKARTARLAFAAPSVAGPMAAAPMMFTFSSTDPCAPRAWVETNAVHMEWPCFTNACWRLDTSYDLFAWQTIGLNINTNTEPVTNVIVVIDSTVGLNQARYYRVVPVDVNGVRLQ